MLGVQKYSKKIEPVSVCLKKISVCLNLYFRLPQKDSVCLNIYSVRLIYGVLSQITPVFVLRFFYTEVSFNVSRQGTLFR